MMPFSDLPDMFGFGAWNMTPGNPCSDLLYVHDLNFGAAMVAYTHNGSITTVTLIHLG